jgi:hypothetical protein
MCRTLAFVEYRQNLESGDFDDKFLISNKSIILEEKGLSIKNVSSFLIFYGNLGSRRYGFVKGYILLLKFESEEINMGEFIMVLGYYNPPSILR